MTSNQDSGLDEPFFDAFRQLQPDVEVVVLPPEEPVDALLARPHDLDGIAHEALGQVESVLPAALTVRDAASRWRPAPHGLQEHVSEWAQTYAHEGDALNALLLLRDAVIEAGWAAAPVPAPTPRMTASAPTGLIRVDATVDGRTFTVQGRGPLVRVHGGS